MLLFVHGAQAAIDAYPFDDPLKERRFNALISELRCPKCQNQTIAGSNAPLAADLRQKVYTMVSQGRSRDEIVAYMTERYGDFVSYRPPLKPITWALWFGPITLIAIVGASLLFWVRRRSREAAPELDARQRARLDALLEDEHR